MRILNVTAQKPDSTGSGIYLSELIKGFDKMGHEQALLAGVYKEDVIDVPDGVRTYPVYFKTEKLNYPIAGMSDEMPYESTRYCDMTEEMTVAFRVNYKERMEQILEEFQPEVILCHHLYYVTSLVRELAGDIPVYGISHGSDLRQIKKNPWQRDYIKKMIPTLKGIFALHKEQKEEICRIFGCDEGRVRVIGTGYNNHRFFIDEEIKKQKEMDVVRLIFAGKLSEKKGVMSLLRSMNQIQLKNHQKLELILAGGYGNQEEYDVIKLMASESSIPVVFAGKLNQEELAAKMNEADVFVLPSFYEGLPLVIIEAMACGLKVVCTDLPGIKPWVEDKVPNHGVRFVAPPRMEREDEPIKDSLPSFEQDLARAIQDVCLNLGQEIEQPDLSNISWEGLCRMIMQIIEGDL